MFTDLHFVSVKFVQIVNFVVANDVISNLDYKIIVLI